jgi:hypothetical protein
VVFGPSMCFDNILFQMRLGIGLLPLWSSLSCNKITAYTFAGFTLGADPLQRTMRVCLMSVVCDAPARCLVQDFMQFNGYFGCPTCYSTGASVPTSDTGRTHAYPFDTEHHTTGHGVLRTHEETVDIAKAVEKSGCNDRGVKGFSPLLGAPKFDMIRGVTVDYMHCVLLGVTKMLLHLWTDKANKDKVWYVGNYCEMMNERLRSISPPHLINRIPRDLNVISQWKASEYRAFLLFYSIPCLYGILPQEYFEHYLLLVESIHILLGTSIAKQDLRKATLLLRRFCCSIDYLYHARYETPNVHALLHISRKVNDLGPLWAHSCFFFEDLNGDIRKLFNGTQNVQCQILYSVSVNQKIPELVTRLPLGSKEHDFYLKLAKKMPSRNRLLIADKYYAIGNLKRCEIPPEVRLAIESVYGLCGGFKQFLRIMVGKSVIHCKQYLQETKRNSYTVKYMDSGRTCFGHVQYYLECTYADRDVYLAVILALDTNSDAVLSADTTAKLQHITPVVSTKKTSVVPVTDIQELCMFLAFQDQSFDCVTQFPNQIERD